MEIMIEFFASDFGLILIGTVIGFVGMTALLTLVNR